MNKRTSGEAPAITSEAIAAYVDSTVLRRSHEYVGRSLFDRVLTGSQIRARCKGSMPTPYVVTATLANGQVLRSTCTCPYEGVCKHVGALLLAWLGDADSFEMLESIDTLLERLNRAQLQMIVKRLAQRDPTVQTMVAQLANPPTSPPNIKSIRKQIKKLLGDAVNQYENEGAYPGEPEYEEYYEYGDDEPDSGAKLEIALEPYTLLAQSCAEHGALDQALKVYLEIATQIQEVMESLDYYDPLSGILSECVDGIANCARSATTEALRTSALEALVDIHVTDMSEGGYGIGKSMVKTLLELAPGDALHSIAERLRQQMKASNPYQSGQVREEIETLLGDRLTIDLRIELLRESGERRELVDLLLEEERTAEALKEIESSSAGYTIDFADLLVNHGMADEAVALVERAARSEKRNNSLIEWLYQQAKRSNDEEASLRYARKAFQVAPALERYRRLRNAAKNIPTWPRERDEIVDGLDRREHGHLIVDIYLIEADHDAALAAFGVVEQTRSPFTDVANLRIQVAQAVATSHPHEAIALYLVAAFDLIEAQGRENYATAAGYLARVKAIYAETGDVQQWHSTLRAIRERYSNRRALREEMQRANL